MKLNKLLNPMSYINILLKKNTRKFFIQNYIYLSNNLLHSYITKKKIKTIGKDNILSKLLLQKNNQHKSNEITKNGFSLYLNFLEENEVENIKNQLLPLCCNNHNNLDYDKTLSDTTIDNMDRQKTHVAQYYRKDLVQIPEILSIANNKNILAIVQGFLGAKPTIVNINAWWSFSGRNAPKEAQNFHRDKDGLKFVKFFIYLTDVDKESGPHIYIKGTSSINLFRSPFKARYCDEEIFNIISKEREVIFTGNKGDAFFEDTFGIHKGLLPKSQDRLLLQIEYALEPIIWESYPHSEKINNIENYDSYINRLILQ